MTVGSGPDGNMNTHPDPVRGITLSHPQDIPDRPQAGPASNGVHLCRRAMASWPIFGRRETLPSTALTSWADRWAEPPHSVEGGAHSSGQGGHFDLYGGYDGAGIAVGGGPQ